MSAQVHGRQTLSLAERNKLRAVPMKERFATKWMPEPFSGCWLWTGGINTWGYGVLHRRGAHESISAHRAAWELHRGPIPNGLFVLHKCDTRMCVNPDHLFLGTQRDNIHDCMAKGRNKRGIRK
jgi:hypothetical protein